MIWATDLACFFAMPVRYVEFARDYFRLLASANDNRECFAGWFAPTNANQSLSLPEFQSESGDFQ